MSLECNDRNRLQQQYISAVNAYGEALTNERSPQCTSPQLARQLTQRANTACQKALKTFTRHVEEHGCYLNKAATEG
jgi:hypothetical protein